MFLVSILIFQLSLPVNGSVLNLYQLHNLAFPLGIGFAVLLSKVPLINILQKLQPVFKYFLVVFSILLFGYLAIHSGIGKGLIIEQLFSCKGLTGMR